MSVRKIRRSPEKYMGAVFGIASVILSLVGLITILWILFATDVFPTKS